MEDQATFGIVDYCVFISVLVISFIIGIATTIKGNKSPEEFLTGNRSFKALPVGMSLLTSFVSAIHLIGYTSEVYTHGLHIAMVIPGSMIGIGLTAVLTLPVIYPLNMTSVNEYIDLRFQAPVLRGTIMFMTFFQVVIYMGVSLYAPSIALAAVTPLGFIPHIFIMGVVCTIYSTVGGIRAVIWTDVFQFFVMMGGIIAICVISAVQFGMEKIFTISEEGGRMDLRLTPTLYETHNGINSFLFGLVFFMQLYGVAQINVQRTCTVPTIKDARKVVAINVIGMGIVNSLIFFGGLAAYSSYAGCDPYERKRIQKKDQILSYFISDKFGYIPGLPGLFVATLIATSLSTFSSVVNAQVAIIWKDGMTKAKFFSNLKPTTAVFINKVMTLLIGCLFIGIAILTSKTTSVIQLIFAVGGLGLGGIYGVFILGIWFPRSNAKGAWSGLVLSLAFLIWIHVGGMFYSTRTPNPLPLSADLCIDESNNATLYDILNEPNLPSVRVINETQKDTNETLQNTTSSSFPLLYLYEISHTIYPMIGTALCIVIGILVSYITGPTDPKTLDPRLISPFIRKYYAHDKTNQRETLELNEEKS